MSTLENGRTLVQRLQAYIDYDFLAVDHEALVALSHAASDLEHVQKKYNIVLRTLECYLRVTSQTFEGSRFETSELMPVCAGYIGAMYSTKFYEVGDVRRWTIASAALDLFEAAGIETGSLRAWLSSTKNLEPELEMLRDRFEAAPLDELQLWLWSAWPSKNRHGAVTYFPLFHVYKRLGRGFTQHLYVLCDEYFSGYHAQTLFGLRAFSLFVRDYPNELTATHFKDAAFLEGFWREFFAKFFIGKYDDGKGHKIATLTQQWAAFRILVVDHLIPGQLMVATAGPFPYAPKLKVQSQGRNTEKNHQGLTVNTKLLTDIPLEISDSMAIELLFKVIKDDLCKVVDWAEREIEDIWRRYNKARSEAPLGTAVDIGLQEGKLWLLSRDNPGHLRNAAATLLKHGFLTAKDTNATGIFPRPLTTTAYELGLPQADSLFPHCIFLVREHPAITASFLETFELYDKAGRLAGLIEQDDKHYLVGYKRRRGAALAQQKILLSERSLEVVRQLIAITSPFRDYLKHQGDDSWRYLLITCGRGFGYPKRVRKMASASSPEKKQRGIVSRMVILDRSADAKDRAELVARLSLPAVRASAGVVVYLETHSVRLMAEALGHAEHDPELLDSYLPTCIRLFFQERWIRLFQNGIILEAMKDSPNAIRASDFQSLNEVTEFLKEHALRIPTWEDDEALSEEDSREVTFGINVEILTVLLSLSLAVDEAGDSANELATFWAQLAVALKDHIEAGNTARADLEGYLRRAKLVANADSMRHMVKRA